MAITFKYKKIKRPDNSEIKTPSIHVTIINVLKKEKELSVKGISEKVGSQWSTTIKALDFMKKGH